MEPGNGKTIALWVVTLLLAAMFLMVGGMKLLGKEDAQFIHWGYPSWFAYVIGVVELGGAILLLFPSTAALAAAMLAIVMIGATITHIRAGEISHIALPAVLLVLLIIVGYARRTLAVKAAS